jgi:ketosteroid isomerase-like protein
VSQENVDVVRRAFQARTAGDAEAAYAMLAPDVVFDTSRSEFPDAGVYRGPEGVRNWFDGLADAFGEGARFDVEEIEDFGDRVLVEIRARGHGLSSGIAVDWRFVSVFTFRDGKVVRIDRFANRAEALRALGMQ